MCYYSSPSRLINQFFGDQLEQASNFCYSVFHDLVFLPVEHRSYNEIFKLVLIKPYAVLTYVFMVAL